MLLLHQMWPHVHHVHVTADAADGITEAYHHHHNDAPDAFEGILDILLHSHVHAEDANVITVLKNAVNPDITQNLYARSALPFGRLLPETGFLPQNSISYPPPDNSLRIFTSTSSLRGPPFMG